MSDQTLPARDSILAEIAAAPTLDALEQVRVRALGKAGIVTGFMKTLGSMSPEERQLLGPVYNSARDDIAAAVATRRAALDTQALNAKLAAERQDMTLPVALPPRGRIHPVSQVLDELTEIFADLGFAVATGPEIEDEWHNFSALNIPEDHPARAMHDTFYFPTQMGFGGGSERTEEDRARSSDGRPPRYLLRTHTSPVQIRTMLNQQPPIRTISPGRVYRSDSDATHTPMFHQIEALVIDRDITMGHLKWTVETFLKAFFEADDVHLRFFPSFFPFTEPSADVQVGYTMENGVRKHRRHRTAWLEVMGSRHGPPARAARMRPRSGRMAGLRLRHRRRSPRDAQIRHPRSPRDVRRRCPLARALRLRSAGRADTKRRSGRVTARICPPLRSGGGGGEADGGGGPGALDLSCALVAPRPLRPATRATSPASQGRTSA